MQPESTPSSSSPRSLRMFTVIPEAEEEGGYSGRCLELPGAISQGETLEELKANMTEAIQLTLEYLESRTKSEKAQKKIVIELPA